MTSVITCDAMFEPNVKKQNEVVIGLQLNFELREPIANPARDFRRFLEALPTTRFFLYKADASNLLFVAELKPIDDEPNGLTESILAWLEANKIDDADGKWHNAEPEADDYTSSARPSAGQLLGGAQTWPAPLPQQAGLNRLLSAPAGADYSNHCVVALQGLNELTDPPDDLKIKAPYPEFDSMLVSTDVPNDHPDLLVNRLLSQVAVEGISDGFFKLDTFSDETQALVDSLRRKAAGQFWTMPQLIALSPPIPAPPDDTYDEAVRRKQALERLQRRAGHAVACLLDTLLLSLTMPWDMASAANPQKDESTKYFAEAHFVLGPIVQCVFGAAEDMTAAGEIDGDYDVVLEPYPGHVRKWVSRLHGSWEEGYLATLSELLERKTFEVEPSWKENPAEHQRQGKPILASLLVSSANDPGELFDFVAADAQLDQELAELVQQLGEEQGFEAVVLQFLRTAKLTDAENNELLLATLFKSNKQVPDEKKNEDREKRAQFATKVIARISSYFASHYNALEAARQAVGRLVAHAYLDAARDVLGTPSLNEANWFMDRTSQRPALDSKRIFDRLLIALPYFGKPLTEGATDGPDAKALISAWNETCADLDSASAGKPRRFVPDTHPADLSVLLPLPTQDQTDDLFEQLYDGIGLLVRRTSAGRSTSWSQINRVRLKRFDDTDITAIETAILPAQPVFDDGERSLSFEYRGHWFAFDTLGDPDGGAGGARPYYEVSPPALHEKFENPPSLAYGTSYDVAAFAVSRNGVLPEAVASGATGAESTRPKGDLSTLKDVPTKSFAYSRKTGIGRAILKAEKGALPQRFNKDSVLPLAFDYPRVGLASKQGSSSWIDLWRREDGSGLILLPQEDGHELPLKLNDFVKSDESKVLVALYTEVAPEFRDDDFVELQTGTNALTIKRADGRIILLGKTFDHVDPTERGWIRLKLEATYADAAITLADPAGDLEGNSRGVEHDSKDFVLLRPQGNGWNNDFSTGAKFVLIPPSMAPADLDRWLENPEMYEKASEGDATKEQLKTLQKLLLGIAYDEGEDAVKLLRTYSGFLPDLAVAKLYVELTILDDIGCGDHGKADVRCEIVNLPKLPSLIEKSGGVPFEDGYVQLDRLEDFLKELFKQRTIEVAISNGDTDLKASNTKIQVSVPAGRVAQLRVRVAVEKSLYRCKEGSPPVIDKRLQQFSVGSLSDIGVEYHLFDGAALRIEVMAEPPETVEKELIELANKSLRIASPDGARAYELKCDPTGEPVWQWCGRAVVASQRWRHLGLPQTHWFNPSSKTNATTLGQQALEADAIDPVTGPVVGIEQSREGLRDFEAEAFDGRDADVQWRAVRLAPLGEASILHEEIWELPSATMFRHRVTFQNRYAPAMENPEKSDVDPRQWQVVGAEAHVDWLRVVVLADRNRIRLTRPQLRALQPLPLSEQEGACPPILAMLAEPPFADGGLADRIAAGVATGIGYEMKEKNGEQRLGVRDTRQEFGPDPQLSYLHLAEELNGAISLDGAGPIGLTFDREAGTSAAFANSAWLFTPSALTDGNKQDFQEHFASVSLQRYLAPEWISPSTPEQNRGYEFTQSRWFDVRGEEYKEKNVERYYVTLYCDEQKILTVSKEGGKWKATTTPQAILPEPDADKSDSVSIAEFAAGTNWGCSLLHQPLDDKRAALSIFAVEPGRVPLRMASFHWISGKQPKVLKLKIGDGEEQLEGQRTTASLVTDMEWTRTARDLNYIAATKKGVDGHAEQVAIANLAIKNCEVVDRDGNVLWLRPSLHDSEVPLHLQRFLAILPTRLADGPGRAMQVYNPKIPIRPLFTPELNAEMKEGIAQAHLLEIECPARPLASDSIIGIPPEFKNPTFDIREYLGDDDLKKCSCLLALIRPSGTYTNFKDRDISITFPCENIECSVSISDEKVEMVVLSIDRIAGEHQAWLVRKDGTADPLQVNGKSKMADSQISFAVNSTKEWWGSVAVLSANKLPEAVERSDENHFVAPYELEVDFKWMFGPLLSERDLEASINHDALRKTKAAQARIISVYSAIQVR